MKIELTVQELKELTKTPVAGTTDVMTISLDTETAITNAVNQLLRMQGKEQLSSKS